MTREPESHDIWWPRDTEPESERERESYRAIEPEIKLLLPSAYRVAARVDEKRRRDEDRGQRRSYAASARHTARCSTWARPRR